MFRVHVADPGTVRGQRRSTLETKRKAMEKALRILKSHIGRDERAVTAEKTTMTGYMLDTNFFNRVVAGEITVDLIARHAVFATHVQRDELDRTRDDTKRVQLLAAFDAVGPYMKPTSTAVWDDSKWDECQWSADDGVYEAMLARLEELDRVSGKKAKEFNQSRDIRIAETAIRNSLTLVTNDRNLAAVMLEFGGDTITAEEFKTEGSGA